MVVFPELPLTSAYLEQLPAGLDSYPDAQVKGSFMRAIVNVRPDGFDPHVLPDPIAEIFLNPPELSEWVPEVRLVTVMTALRDAAFDDDASHHAFESKMLASVLAGPMYRVLFAVISPRRMAVKGEDKWTHMHRGTRRESLEFNENGNLGRIHYPSHLFSPRYVDVCAEAIATVYRLSRAPDPAVRVLEYTPTSSLLEVVYDQGRPRGEVLGGADGLSNTGS